MQYIPHEYQKYATEKIIELPACALFMEMGLGKTVSTLTAINELIYDRFEVQKVLVIAPYRVADDTWTTEADKWDHLKHLRVSKVLGTSGERIAALEADADIYVINRENVTWLVNLTGKEWPFEMIVVDELSTRMVKLGCRVDAYNRYGRHTAGKKYAQYKGKEYKGIRLITIPTFRNGKLNAIVYSILATIRALFGGYDVIHFHAEGPCVMAWLPKIFGIRTVATIHGLDWQRSKWGNFASYVLKEGEKTAVRHADEIIVLSRNMQDYFMNTYQRKTRFIPNGITRPNLYEPNEIQRAYGLEKDSYLLFVARIVPEKGLHYLIEAYKQIDTDKRLGDRGRKQPFPDLYGRGERYGGI